MLSPRGHPAYYPQPIIYWSYPSPPGSPNTYFATHTSSPHLNGLASPQPGLVRFGDIQMDHDKLIITINSVSLQFPMEFIPPPGTAMHNPPQFSPRHPPHHMQQNGSILSGNSPHLHIPFNNHHHHNPLPPHNGPSVVDLNNNAMHMYNQPSLLLATPLSPGQQYPTLPAPQIHSSASSETGPAESESTTPTSGSCSGESSSNSESNQNLATIPPFYNGGSHQQHQVQQQQFYHHQNGMIATQLAEDLQTKINPLASNQYVSLFIV